MHIAERIGRALAVGLAGQGAPQDGLAHGAFAPIHHHNKGIGLAIGRVLELDLHPPGDDAAGVMADGEHRLQQSGFLLLGRPFRVFAEAHRQAVDLQELGQIAHAVVLEQEGPDQGADKAGAGEIPRLRLGLVHDPAERIEGRPLLAAVPQSQLVPVIRVGLEPGGIAPDDALGELQPLHHLPAAELLGTEPLEHRIGGVKDGVIQPGEVLQQLADHLAVALLGGGGIAGRLYGPAHPEQGAAPLAELALQVSILLLHVFGQLALGDEAPLLRLFQRCRSLARGEPHRGVFAVVTTQLGQLGVVLGLRLLLQAQRIAMNVDDPGHYQPPLSLLIRSLVLRDG
ncbi:hypothetical protein D3C72_492200 [compost metagenome]